MAVDALLWFLLAGMVAFISCGCVFTAGDNRLAKLGGDRFDREVDRAA